MQATRTAAPAALLSMKAGIGSAPTAPVIATATYQGDDRRAADRRRAADKAASTPVISRPANHLVEMGFVSVFHAPRKADTPPEENLINFRGLFVPGRDRSDNLRNRFIVMNLHAPDWFRSLCQEIASTGSDMKLRVKVTGLIGEAGCHVYPCARDEAHARKEWGRHQEELKADPLSLDECTSPRMVTKFVYQHMAREKLLTIVKWSQDDDSALAVSPAGIIYRFSGGSQIYNFTDGIKMGVTTLEKEIERYVTDYRIYTLAR